MKRFLLGISAVSVVLSGCTHQEDIDLLQKELIEVKKELSQIKQNQEKMKNDLSILSERVDRVSKVSSQNSLEIQKMKSFGATTEKSSRDIEEKEGVEVVKIPENPDKLYKYALDSYYKGKVEEAKKAFKEFINRFKDSELYDNAIFWLGQVYLTEGRYQTAVETFDRLINGCETGQITDCNKLPTAMYKKAVALSKMGEKKKAEKVFKTIIKRFPDTEEAELSKKKLRDIE